MHVGSSLSPSSSSFTASSSSTCRAKFNSPFALQELGMERVVRARKHSHRDILNKENEPRGPPEKKRKFSNRDASVKSLSEVKGQSCNTLNLFTSHEEVDPSLRMCREQSLSFSVNVQGELEADKMTTEDIEALLRIKIAGKTRFDLKTKNEQLVEYVKKLRACIRHCLQVQATQIGQCEHLQNQLQEEKQSWDETLTKMKNEQLEQQVALSSVKDRCSSLEGELKAVIEGQKELLLVNEKVSSSLQVVDAERAQLHDEVEKIKKELSNANEQVFSLQDINKRLTEYNSSLQAYNIKLQNDAVSAAAENGKTQQEKIAILESLSAARGSVAALQSQLDASKLAVQEETKQKNSIAREMEKLHVELQNAIEERNQFKSQIEALRDENTKFRDFTGKSAAELEVVTSKAIALEESYMCQSEQIKILRHQLDAAHQKLQLSEGAMERQRTEEAEHLKRVQELQSRLIDAEQRLNEGEMLRRKLHNTIQELKGNIRVFCRVRPLLPDDDSFVSDQSNVEYPQSTELLGRGIELIQSSGQKYSFSFDKVFSPEVTQKDVFEEISQLVQSALDGYKVCIFAYGQTGSGKTYTMLGQPDQPDHKGLIPRSLEQIFKTSQMLQCQGWKFKMQASMLEIYNEAIRDLLVSPKLNNTDTQKNDGGIPVKNYTIKHDALGNTIVSDLTLVEVTHWMEVSTLLQRAANCRSVGKTAMNEQSSRSHCVFTLRISGINESTEQQVHGVLNLVDLAGSERLSRSGATGDRLKETQAINKSLSSLGDVILAIGNKEQHIPYRNSKLTYLLQPCLGGDSKTLMFVNISPDSKSFNESLCSLRFAAKANACEIGVPRRHTFTRGTEARLSTS